MFREQDSALQFARVAVVAVAAAVGAAQAQTTISQAKAIKGGVTAGDAAGFPVTIDTPGAYVLTSDLDVPAGKDGIVVTVPGVTIDLGGFNVRGSGICSPSNMPTSCTGTGAGVKASLANGGEGLSVVRNGLITGFQWGVVIHGGRAERLTVAGNTFGVAAASATVAEVEAMRNVVGIKVTWGRIERAVARNNYTGLMGENVAYDSAADSHTVANHTGAKQLGLRGVFASGNNVANAVFTSSY